MVKTKCEVYSRVVGFIRPVSNWNDSKQAEFGDRVKFDEFNGSRDQAELLGSAVRREPAGSQRVSLHLDRKNLILQ